MNKFAEKLFNDFPLIFNKEKSERWAISLSGVECDEGWFDLIYNLSKDINDIVSKWPTQNQEDFYIQQIKEKFGTLRYYTSIYDEEVEELITKAEYQSAKTCEICGKEGKTQNVSKYWIKTVCDEHVPKET